MVVSDEGVWSQYESSQVVEGFFFSLIRPPLASRGVPLNSRNDRYLVVVWLFAGLLVLKRRDSSIFV